MFSKILIKLIDQAIVPAILLLTVRIVSVVLISYQLNIPFNIAHNGFLFGSVDQFLAINSYSLLAMIGALSLGLGYILLKSLVFHASHISPQTTAKVFSAKLAFFIQDSYHIYSQGAIWLSYLYLLTLVTGIMALSGTTYAWVFYIGLALSIVKTILFVLDIEKEIDIENAGEDFNYYEDEEETLVLSFGEDYV